MAPPGSLPPGATPKKPPVAPPPPPPADPPEAGGQIGFTGRSQIAATADGDLTLTPNNTGSLLSTLSFGPNAQSAPQLRPTSNVLTLATVGSTAPTSLGGFTGFWAGTLTNTAAYAAIVGSVCGAATECFFAVGAEGKLPAGAINAARHRLEIILRGVYSVAGATDTITLNVKLCQVSGCASGTVVVLGATGAVIPGAAVTTQGWESKVDCNVFTAGASGTLDCQGLSLFALTGLTALQADDMVNAAALTVNTTVDEFISASATWNNATAGNTITLRNFGVKVF